MLAFDKVEDRANAAVVGTRFVLPLFRCTCKLFSVLELLLKNYSLNWAKSSSVSLFNTRRTKRYSASAAYDKVSDKEPPIRREPVVISAAGREVPVTIAHVALWPRTDLARCSLNGRYRG